MQKGVSTFVKGVGAGMLTGMAVVATGSILVKSNKHMKKNANKAVRAIGDVIDNIGYMMK